MKCETKCIRSSRAGRFKISLLEQTKTYGQPENVRDYRPEKTVAETRVVIQHGMKRNGEWVNQTIFCSASDFRNLQNAIDDFTDANEDGDDESPDSSISSANEVMGK
jgi:hypothetical protein